MSGGFNPIHLRHQTSKSAMSLGLTRLNDRLLAVRGLSDHFYVFGGFEQYLQTLSEEPLIVGNQKSKRHENRRPAP